MYQRKMNLEDVLANHIYVQNAALGDPDVFGVEVELEGKGIINIPPGTAMYWQAHNDGSLRKLAPGDEAIEYVSSHPFDLKTTELAVELLFKHLNKPGVKVYESYRTSIHVHVNFARETFRTIYNFMTLSLILDELLVSQNGEHRQGNNFCLRAKDAMGQVIGLVQSIEAGQNFFGVVKEERYSSINFASLTKFGSIEFRSMECTTHEGRVMQWIRTLAQLKERAKLFKNPMEIIQQFSLMGPQQFLVNILGPYSLKYINVPGMETMLFNGMRIAQDVAYASLWKEAS